ncbi:hypothetical protein M2103_001591 [Ereboglobus sp. PH5-5]|uniref:hypothetical protein n=1 Tax=Ereboglobus sp. PH5-5 TaxID=2940529 RepID=UPI0024071283|nr:hypothetical protein [Ereboglobus sp. PH5-5]MDF9833367.1 hypothetical protein [Ereboglobus sp. PH5-5]
MTSLRFLRLTAALAACAAGLFFAPEVCAGAGFSGGLSKADYEAAGLTKLSAAERAHLDALVRAHAAGACVANAETQAAAKPIGDEPVAVVATDAATAKPKSPPKPNRQKVKVDPGTEIEYNTMELELAGTFAGFEKGTVFTLSNGQRWKVVSGSYSCGPDPRVKKVRVKPGVLGSFFLEFERVKTQAKVKLVK